MVGVGEGDCAGVGEGGEVVGLGGGAEGLDVGTGESTGMWVLLSVDVELSS